MNPGSFWMTHVDVWRQIRLQWRQKPITAIRGTLLDRDEIDHEDDGSVRWDTAIRCSVLTVTHFGGHDDNAATSHSHGLDFVVTADPLGEAFDYSFKGKGGGSAAFPGGVELFAIGITNTDVLHRHR